MTTQAIRTRRSARLLLLNQAEQLLLFHFRHTNDALAGRSHWATPGGGLNPGESFEEGAIRECVEETGIVLCEVGLCIAKRQIELKLPSGEDVLADERYFLVRVSQTQIREHGWTDDERSVIAEWRWWSMDEIAVSKEQIWPENLVAMIQSGLSAGI